jgi:hypothetical protein
MICAKERGRGNVEEQAHGGADDRGAEASRGGAESGGRGARSGLVDAYKRECLALEVDTSFASRRVLVQLQPIMILGFRD